MKKQAISRKIAGVLAVVLILAGGSGCASAELSDDFDKDTVEMAAKEVVDQLNSGDYAAIEESYNCLLYTSSSDSRFEMDFKPILDRAAKVSALVIETDQHQVFGHLSGRAVLDDGSALEAKDILCACEVVHNRYCSFRGPPLQNDRIGKN